MGTTDKKDFDTLLAVQVVDKNLLALRRKQEKIPESIRAEETGLEQFRQTIGAERKQLEELVRRKKQLELEIDGCVEEIQKFKTQQFQVKKNEEYNALGKEIADRDHRKDQLEEKAIGVIGDIEALEAKLARMEEEGRGKEREMEGFRKRVAGELEALEARIGEAEERRAELVRSTASGLVTLYDRIRGGKPDGVAIALVERDSCSGCHARVPPQRRNELMRSDQVVLCEACGRILVLDLQSGGAEGIV